ANDRAWTYRCKISDGDVVPNAGSSVDENECANLRSSTYHHTTVDIAAWTDRRRSCDHRGRVDNCRLAGEPARAGLPLSSKTMSGREKRNDILAALDRGVDVVGLHDASARQDVIGSLDILHDGSDRKPEACAGFFNIDDHPRTAA